MRINGRECDDGIVGDGDTIAFRQELLLLCVRRAPCPAPLHYWEAAGATRFGDTDAAGIVGESPAAWRVREQIAFAAKSGQHVLIVGESGTGKELTARAVHRLSSRATHALVARNAATFPAGLIDAEVFGNARNYPNPGMADRPGLVGQADGGFLFLDEIGELPLELQSHLLRVLDAGGEYQRLGEPTIRRSDFRLLAATNRNPSELRHDLMARLIATISLPTLAERREDIPLLLRHLALRAAKRSPELAGRFLERKDDASFVRIDAKLVDALVRRRRYRANTRELEGLLWRAMAASRGDVIIGSEDVTAEPPDANGDEPHGAAPLRAPNRKLSTEEIRETLRRESGNVARAAKSLGLSSRYALYRMLAKLGIDAKDSN
jgi:DNA-binding NtrC family response regulator